MVSLMQNEGKTDDRKIMITFLSDDIRAPSESLMKNFGITCLFYLINVR